MEHHPLELCIKHCSWCTPLVQHQETWTAFCPVRDWFVSKAPPKSLVEVHAVAIAATVTSALCLCVQCGHQLLQVKVISNSTTLIADAANKEDISMRVKQIKKELSETDSVYDTEKLSERIAKLAGGVAVIKVLFCQTWQKASRNHPVMLLHSLLCQHCYIAFGLQKGCKNSQHTPLALNRWAQAI